MPDDIKQRRQKWLKIAKQITVSTIQRTDLIRSGCVTARMTDEADQEADRESIDKLSKAILSDLVALANIEAAEPHIGSWAILDPKPSKTMSHVITLMIAARLSGEASKEVNLVSDVMELVAARHPDMALEIRLAFRHDGQLRPHVWLSKADVLDYSRKALGSALENGVYEK